MLLPYVVLAVFLYSALVTVSRTNSINVGGSATDAALHVSLVRVNGRVGGKGRKYRGETRNFFFELRIPALNEIFPILRAVLTYDASIWNDPCGTTGLGLNNEVAYL